MLTLLSVLMAFCAAAVVWFVYTYVVRMYVVRKKMPPGPFPWPLVGNMMMFKDTTIPFGEAVARFSKVYGDPMTIWLGTSPAVFLHQADTTREALVDNLHGFQGRPAGLAVNLFLGDSQDIAFAPYNETWHLHKKLAMRAVRSIIDSSKLVWKVNQTVEEAVKRMLTAPGPVVFSDYAQLMISNILTTFCFGERCNLDDPEFVKSIRVRKAVNEAIEKISQFDGLPGIKNFSWILHRYWTPARQAQEQIAWQEKFFQTRFDKHKKTFDPEVEPEDIVDALLLEQHQLRQHGEAEKMTDDHLLLVVSDIFEGGVDTSQGTLRWVILFLMEYPEIQEQCYQNINEVIGDRCPELTDRKSLPFVEACILEALRFRAIGPLGVPTTPSRPNAKLGGYEVPSDALVMTNLYALHFDPKYWNEPEKFNPSRFIENGSVVKPPSFLPFGCGKRVCMGESLAKNDLFLVTTGLLQKLKFSKVADEQYDISPPITSIFGQETTEYKVKVDPR
jgi:cytochrome P450